MIGNSQNLLRIGVFYDGQYFYHVSNYYKYSHPRRARISLEELHRFIRNQVARKTSTDVSLCQIVDAHYFRGRLPAQDINSDDKLFNERMFDDILSTQNVVTHYMPLKQNQEGRHEEKGIDVWLALEAYEMSIYKRFDVLVLITGDGDYVPLVRKLNTIGTRVMLLSWEYEYNDQLGQKRDTRTSLQLLKEVSYPVPMHSLIDNGDPDVNQLFIPATLDFQDGAQSGASLLDGEMDKIELGKTVFQGAIQFLKEGSGFGFISSDSLGNNLFFHHKKVENTFFNDLRVGQKVEFTIIPSDSPDHKYQASNIRILSQSAM